MAKTKKAEVLTLEEKLQQALVPQEEQPYKVPDNWCWAKLNYLVCIFTGKRDANYGDENGKYLFFTCASEPIKSKTYSFEGESLLLPGNGANVGQVIYYNGQFEAYQRTYILQKKSKQINLKFIFYHLVAWWKEYNKEKQYGTATNYIKLENFNSYILPFPPLSEQQRIVDRIESLFAKLDEAKEKAQEVVDGFEERKAAILHKAFTGELTSKWRAEHGIGIDSWGETELGEVCNVNPKKIDTKNLSDDLKVSFYPMASLSEVYGEILYPEVRLLKEVKKGFTNFSEGDVVFAKITPCMENGKSAIIGKLVNNIGYGTTEFYVLRCSNKLYNRYLFHIVRSKKFRKLAKNEMTGAVGQQRVPKSFMERYVIRLPKLKEQYKIVEIVDELFAKEQHAKEAAESVLEQIDLIKKSILAKAFRGELGTNNPREESAVELLKACLQEQ